jgi:hypothetical protein
VAVPADTVAQNEVAAAEVAPAISPVVYGSAVLPVQPKITNVRPAVIEDLATMVPSAPAQQQNPTKTPAPLPSNGLFGRIAAELAGSVVPTAFMPYGAIPVRTAALVLIVLASVLLSAGFLGVLAGNWLRRGGYAHAARSDVAGAGLSFATPFRMGYVSALSPSHSPFLMVADTKTVLSMVCNAYRKEEM